MSQRPPGPSNADIAAWLSKKLSVRRSTTRLAACSLPIAKLAQWVAAIVADVITAIQRLMQGFSMLLHAKTYTDSQQVAPLFSTDLSGPFPGSLQQVFHRLSTGLSTGREQRAVIAEDHPRRIVSGGAGDAAAGIRAAAAVVETPKRPAIVGM